MGSANKADGDPQPLQIRVFSHCDRHACGNAAPCMNGWFGEAAQTSASNDRLRPEATPNQIGDNKGAMSGYLSMATR